MLSMMDNPSDLDTKERLRIVEAHDIVFQRIATVYLFLQFW
jgi:hypothetical protein